VTIPIVPGPWSFLSGLGKTVGNYAEAREGRRQRIRSEMAEDRAEASKNLTQMLDLYSKGILKKLDVDAVLELGGRAGIGDFLSGNVVPRPENVQAEATSEYLQQLFQPEAPIPAARGNVTQGMPAGTAAPGVVAEQQAAQAGRQRERQAVLSAGKPVTSADVAKIREETAIAGERARVAEEGGPAGRLVTQTVAPELAEKAEATARDVRYEHVAGQTVDSALARMGGNILTTDLNALADTAWQTAQEDARSRNYTLNESLTRPYIEAAIAGKYRDAQTEEAKVRAAASRPGSDTYDDYVRILQQNEAQIRAQLSALPKPSDETIRLSRAYEAQLARQRTPEEQAQWEASPATAYTRSAYESVQQYNKTVNQLNTELNGTRDAVNNALTGKIAGVSAIPSRADVTLPQATITTYANQLRTGVATREQLQAAVDAGGLTTADQAAIIQEAFGGAAAAVAPPAAPPPAAPPAPAPTRPSPTGGRR
jgi:hypothetical protein